MSLDTFHPTIRRWFSTRLGEPTAPQRRGWPAIRAGGHTLIAAPTGSGKTLAAFLSAIDALVTAGPLPDETRVLYVSPLKALGNDVQKNLQGPLEELRALDPELPEVRVLVRSGDTTSAQRAAMVKRPPHILVTTPESLYILLTSESGRAMLRTVRTVIVDEIHALLGDKRGSHLALSLERLESLAGEVQRIGLSATQKPLEDVGRFLAGAGRQCTLIDEGHLRAMDVAVEIPPSPLGAVCSHETWSEIYSRMAELIREHRTTLVFVGTRKLAERAAAALGKLLGHDEVTCHHSSLSKERRLDAEQRLKSGKLRALVATASLELGIDIGDVDLALLVGGSRSIATFVQRIGRSGHGVGRVPRGRLFPLTQDELVEAAALLRARRLSLLDRTPQPSAPLDILAQQLVAFCVPETWSEDALFERIRRAWPYRNLERERFDAVVKLHTGGRRALLHRDGVNGNLRATRRARLVAVTCGGAIPDTTQYQVLLEPEGTLIGSLDEDFAIESTGGDIFQLGNASWRVLKLEGSTMRVADAHGAPPSLPFWFGEAPPRTGELSDQIGVVREQGVDPRWLVEECALQPEVAEQLAPYLREGRDALGATPTRECVVLERFFDESGGTQLIVHALFGCRINRAFGLALRKRFCRRFGFELQAAANDEAIVLSLGPQHSFPLEEVFDYLHPDTVEPLLAQAALASPLFKARWRWNAGRSLALERTHGSRRVPPPIFRMRAEDLLAEAFPGAAACGETLPPGDVEIPYDHPLVGQTLDDCLHEAMDVDGLVDVLRRLRDGRIRRVAIDTPEPSAFARSILSTRPYTFLDDAPLEERRTQAVFSRRALDPQQAGGLGALDPQAVQRVREEAWPDPRDAEEVHEALLWMGYVTVDEARPWQAWLEQLAAGSRAALEGERWFAAEASRDPKQVLRGRLEALGPVHGDDPLLLELEADGVVLRTQLDGRQAWCDRRLLARIQRYTLDTLRREIEPVSAADFLRFLAAWQHAEPEFQLEGPGGVREVVRQLAGFEAPAAAWEKKLLAKRVRGYRPEWLDQAGLSGAVVWGRLWGSARTALRATPISLFPREEAEAWLGLTEPIGEPELAWPARALRELLAARGALFPSELERASGLLASDAERGLEELIAHGLLTSDSFASLRFLMTPQTKRRGAVLAGPGGIASGRWNLFRRERLAPPQVEFVARALLRRYGVIFRSVLGRERIPVPWRDLARTCRALELRGEIRGGRFVAGFSGEQFALPEAIPILRRIRKRESHPDVLIAAADPLNLAGVLTPGERISPQELRSMLL
jgi:ATP-dependent helicase Lhr and Lhr-like helicase